MPLTDTAIRDATPADKPVRMFDAGGLYLEVSPGGGRWWRLKYRYKGKEKRLSLGVYPEVSLKAARERRDESRNTNLASYLPMASTPARIARHKKRPELSALRIALKWWRGNGSKSITRSGQPITAIE